MLNDFGVQVTIVEASSHLLPAEDEEVGRELTKMLTARGVEVITNISIQTDSCEIRNQSVSITIEQKDDTRTLSADKRSLSGESVTLKISGLKIPTFGLRTASLW